MNREDCTSEDQPRALGNDAEVDPGHFHDERRAAWETLLFHRERRAVGDTTSVSRTPKDEQQQQPIPRFIGLFVYMLQGCANRVTPSRHCILGSPFFFRANLSISVIR